MKQRIFLLLTFCMMAGIIAAEGMQSQRRYTVTNEREFFEVLSPNSHIVIPEGVELNLSKFLNDEMACELLGIKPAHESSGICFVASYHNVDGIEPHIVGMKNITIEGEGKQFSRIVIEPRYAYVLNFFKCTDITLRNVQIGHTEAGFCSGGVLNFDECSDIKIENCDLYGCGTEGITLSNTHGMSVSKTFVHDCTYSIMTLHNSSGIRFDDCLFARNREYGLVAVGQGCEEVTFDKCRFHSNVGNLFVLETRITLTGCEIKHDGELGNIDLIDQTECRWNEAFEASQPDRAPAKEEPEAAEQETVSYHQWKGKDGNTKYHLVYAQKGDVLVGELKWEDEYAVVVNKMLGMVDKEGDIRMHIYNPVDAHLVMREFTVRIDGKEMELFEAATQAELKFKRSKDELRFSMDREPDAYCSPFNKGEVRSFRHSPGEMVGIYQYEIVMENDTRGTVDLSLSGENWETLNANISTLKKGDEMWINAQTRKTDNRIVRMKMQMEDSPCVVKFEICFYSDFIVVRTLEQSDCWGNKSIDGIYVRLAAVG